MRARARFHALRDDVILICICIYTCGKYVCVCVCMCVCAQLLVIERVCLAYEMYCTTYIQGVVKKLHTMLRIRSNAIFFFYMCDIVIIEKFVNFVCICHSSELNFYRSAKHLFK